MIGLVAAPLAGVASAASTPSAPTIIRNAVAGNGMATVSWTTPDNDGGSPITGYVVTPYIGYVARTPVTLNTVATTGEITGLDNGTTYRFRVQALNAEGISGYSAVSNPVIPVGPPAAPTIIRNAVAGNGQATVSWTAPASNGGSPVSEYVVTPYLGWVPLPPVTVDSSATTSTVAGLENGTTYRFRVRAVSSLGTGPYSTASNAVKPVARVIAGGHDHTCAVVTGGAVRCWGSNHRGQLGNGTTQDSLEPVSVSNLTGATVIDAGAEHTCALLGTGSVRCWGSNYYGQLGNGTFTDSTAAVDVLGVSTAVGLAVGRTHACVVLSGGGVRCWGNNAFGQLGDGNRVPDTPGIAPGSPTPVSALGISTAGAISASAEHTCALLFDGTARCWGLNGAGQLGQPVAATDDYCASGLLSGPRCSLRPVAVGELSGATGISAGDSHTCAVMTNGSVRCWGDNRLGELGTPITVDAACVSATRPLGTCSSIPVLVDGIVDAGAVVTGSSHSCALLTSGSARCWGFNGVGELGDGTTADSATPVTVLGVADGDAIGAGADHTCVGGAVGIRCWGWNDRGQVGNGRASYAPTPVATNGGLEASQIDAASWHSCAVSTNGEARCWGKNGFGQLGDGTTVSSSTPVGVAGLSGVTSIAGGSDHTCAVASGGAVYCWGLWRGLGNGSSTSSAVPVAVPGIAGAVSVASAGFRTCAVLDDGTVWCWGGSAGPTIPVAVPGLTDATDVGVATSYACALVAGGMVMCWGQNSFGQLGNGTTVASSSPVEVTAVSGATALTVGGQHACVLLTGGAVACWGSNVVGALGNGAVSTTSPYGSSIPITVPGLTGATAIGAGGVHTCAVLAPGSTVCWGGNYQGQLGTGNTVSSPSPTVVTGLASVVDIDLGGAHTCGVLHGGTITCWGDLTEGQLGDGALLYVSTSTPVLGL